MFVGKRVALKSYVQWLVSSRNPDENPIPNIHTALTNKDTWTFGAAIEHEGGCTPHFLGMHSV